MWLCGLVYNIVRERLCYKWFFLLYFSVCMICSWVVWYVVIVKEFEFLREKFDFLVFNLLKIEGGRIFLDVENSLEGCCIEFS